MIVISFAIVINQGAFGEESDSLSMEKFQQDLEYRMENDNEMEQRKAMSDASFNYLQQCTEEPARPMSISPTVVEQVALGLRDDGFDLDAQAVLDKYYLELFLCAKIWQVKEGEELSYERAGKLAKEGKFMQALGMRYLIAMDKHKAFAAEAYKSVALTELTERAIELGFQGKPKQAAELLLAMEACEKAYLQTIITAGNLLADAKYEQAGALEDTNKSQALECLNNLK